MKFGIVPINLREFTDPDMLIPFCPKSGGRSAMSPCGTAEHVIIPKQYDSVYPYNPDGKLPFKPDAPIIDPLVALTFIASATTTLRLGTRGQHPAPDESALFGQMGLIDRSSVPRTLDAGSGDWLAA